MQISHSCLCQKQTCEMKNVSMRPTCDQKSGGFLGVRPNLAAFWWRSGSILPMANFWQISGGFLVVFWQIFFLVPPDLVTFFFKFPMAPLCEKIKVVLCRAPHMQKELNSRIKNNSFFSTRKTVGSLRPRELLLLRCAKKKRPNHNDQRRTSEIKT